MSFLKHLITSSSLERLSLIVMEEENRGFFNSSVKIANKITPIKRLGLSRKRKSCGSGYNFNAKVHICSENITDDYSKSDKLIAVEETNKPSEDLKDEENDPGVNYDEEIQSLKKRIAEDEEKLKALQSSTTNISQLENLIDLWKDGCKNAFLHLSQLLRERQTESIDFKAVLNQLGVWETMLENFQEDSEISLSECSQ